MYQVNPVIRANRLRADHAAMVELARGSRLISFKCRGEPPDRYLVVYRCRGTVLVGGRVEYSEKHAIEIILHANYPSCAPKFKLRTPMFHPNFKYGDPNLQVCIEARNWVPRERLDDLVLRIGNMITYRNYNPGNPLDGVAAAWAERNRHLFPIDDRPWLTPADSLFEIVEMDVAQRDGEGDGDDETAGGATDDDVEDVPADDAKTPTDTPDWRP